MADSSGTTGVNEFILIYEIPMRLAAFALVFAAVAGWEVWAPRRRLTQPKTRRWANNIGLVAFNTLMLRLLFPLAAVGMAASASTHGWGLFNVFQLPLWLAALIAVIALDFVIWLQHVMVHAIPALWRLHRVHHADLDYDLTTGSRCHPIESILSMMIKFAAILLIGPPVIAVLIFEILLNGMAMFNHANIRLPAQLDRMLRLVVVTPDMHRVHHSVDDDETNSNFGFNLSWWDRLFGTYRDQPRAGHEGMTIGIRGFRQAQETNRLPGMLMLPFRGPIGDYAINRRSFPPTGDMDR